MLFYTLFCKTTDKTGLRDRGLETRFAVK